MKIEIKSDKFINQFNLTSLDHVTVSQKNNEDFLCDKNWYLLSIDNHDPNIINDILINGSSIKHTIYAGTFTLPGDNSKHYSNTLWDKGTWQIWIHTDIGLHLYYYFKQIENGDFGTNLDEKYLHTVDWSVGIDTNYPDPIKQFFKHAHGPRWWNKKYETPYQVLDEQIISNINTKLLYDEIHTLNGIKKSNNGWNAKTLKEKITWPGVSVEDLEYPEFKRIAQSLGYKTILNINWLTLEPNAYIDIHADGNYKDYPAGVFEKYFKGCNIFYYALVNPAGFLFKLGEAGLLPTDKPLLIDASSLPHCVVNQSPVLRETIRIHGIK